MQNYIKLYLKRNFLLILFCVLPISLLFFVVSSFYDVLDYDMWLSLLPVGIGSLCFLVSSLYVLRFMSLIKKQEQALAVSFNDQGCVKLGDLIFLSEEWLICAGSCAFHRDYVKGFSQKKYIGNRGGSGYKITVTTIDGKKYRFWSDTCSNLSKFRKWKSYTSLNS